MGFLDKVVSAGKAAMNDLSKPESFRKGESFEKYVRDVMFPDSDYELIHQTSSYSQNNERYAAESMNPDFLFRDLKTGRRFHVECKYRTDEYRRNEMLEWTYPDQLKRYQEVSKEVPVFIALGIQGSPSEPDFVFLFPLSRVPYCGLYDSTLSKYEFYVKKPVFSSYLWRL